MKLPRPDKSKKYVLEDGSIIYPSGNDYYNPELRTNIKMPDVGKWMLWVKEGEQERADGVMIPFGSFQLTKDSIRYFESPLSALRHRESMEVAA